MGEKEMDAVGSWIADILSAPNDAAVQKRVAAGVRAMCEAFPLYPGRLASYA
jgi:glycine hydroxymethyltransferase